MKILFITPNLSGDFYKAMCPHIGTGYLISILEKNNHKTDAIDMRIDTKLKDLDKKVQSFNPDIIGITFMTRDYEKSYQFVNFLKKSYRRTAYLSLSRGSLKIL